MKNGIYVVFYVTLRKNAVGNMSASASKSCCSRYSIKYNHKTSRIRDNTGDRHVK